MQWSLEGWVSQRGAGRSRRRGDTEGRRTRRKSATEGGGHQRAGRRLCPLCLFSQSSHSCWDTAGSHARISSSSCPADHRPRAEGGPSTAGQEGKPGGGGAVAPAEATGHGGVARAPGMAAAGLQVLSPLKCQGPGAPGSQEATKGTSQLHAGRDAGPEPGTGPTQGQWTSRQPVNVSVDLEGMSLLQPSSRP